ncbi:hypothetical protein GMA92_09555 [Turicibacter sanguinis]|uniref:Uncharacterized protein n=1 Tax=Turicibacter sanguinis TaxID=154288 RepID=A0A9X4XFK7_9FIRM|nr:hypothetical protein [Turicibacter sanguinis]KAB6699916.1 hypothetical protein GAZ90_19335 [Phocaeicola vulgatus]MTK21665.1 hypothetical protein [Turicibacter sanguinis]MTK73145.1 hypothetical protein [Turicibacter sanguinis]
MFDQKEQEFYADGKRVYKKIGKTILYTILVFIVFGIGLNNLIQTLLPNLSVESSNTWSVICCSVGIIFTIFYCTFTLLEKLEKLISKSCSR